MVVGPIQLHINDLELLRTVPGTEFKRTFFHVQENNESPSILIIFYDFYHFWAHGPWDPWDPSFFDLFEKLFYGLGPI